MNSNFDEFKLWWIQTLMNSNFDEFKLWWIQTLINSNCHVLSPGVNGGIQTLNLRIMSWMFNHCATVGRITFVPTFYISHEFLKKYYENFLQISYKFLTNFLQISYKFLTNFLQISYKFLSSFLQVSYKFLTNFLRLFSEKEKLLTCEITIIKYIFLLRCPGFNLDQKNLFQVFLHIHPFIFFLF
jgi:hypothetical protein